jgi:glycosyltransferase involved in cell wall biosynthesis
MNENQKVSVIIPTYNSAKYLSETIESVLKQSYNIIEIIVVDDGSTDESKGVLSKYSGRIKYFYIKNSGPATARNYGIKNSTGEWIAFLDSDDIWLPGKIEKQLNHMKTRMNKSFCCSDWSNFVKVEDTSISVLKNYEAFEKNPDFDLMLKENFVLTSSVLIERKKLLKTNLFWESLKGPEDRHLWLRILQQGNAEICKEIMVLRRFHSANISSTIAFIENQLVMLESIMKWDIISNNSDRKNIVEERIKGTKLGLAYEYSKNKQYKKSAELYYSCYLNGIKKSHSILRYFDNLLWDYLVSNRGK